jgi:hypothetical protein
MQIPFIGGTNRGRSDAIDTQSTINFYPEITGEGSKSGLALIGTPGLRLVVDLNPSTETVYWQEVIGGVFPSYQEQINLGEQYQTIITP